MQNPLSRNGKSAQWEWKIGWVNMKNPLGEKEHALRKN
jgi:hypothetical protein